jgi:hypothetical protein
MPAFVKKEQGGIVVGYEGGAGHTLVPLPFEIPEKLLSDLRSGQDGFSSISTIDSQKSV